VRLLGVSASNLVTRQAEQLSFDDPGHDGSGGGGGGGGGGSDDGPGPGPDQVAQAVDDVRRRFGDAAVGPASLVRGGALKLKRRGDQQWGPSADPDPYRPDPSSPDPSRPER